MPDPLGATMRERLCIIAARTMEMPPRQNRRGMKARGGHCGGGRPWSFDPDLAVDLWVTKEYPTIRALADHLGAWPQAVSRVLHERGVKK